MQFNVEKKMGEKEEKGEKGGGEKWPKDLSFWSSKPEGVCIHTHVHLKASDAFDFCSDSQSDVRDGDV